MNVRKDKQGLSIRFKFLFVTTLLLGLSVGSYLFLAADIFKRDKTELVFDLTRSMVTTGASELETMFVGINDKIKIVSLLSQDTSKRGALIAQSIFQNESDVVFMARSARFDKINEVIFAEKSFAQTYGVDQSFYSADLPKERPIPFTEIQTAGEAVWNATVKNGPPLLGYGKNVLLETDGRDATPFAMIVYVRADKIAKMLGSTSVSDVFLVNRAGDFLLHTNLEKARKIAEAPASAKGHPLFEIAETTPVRTGVAEFKNEDKAWLGAYSRAFGGKVVILSEVAAGRAFSAVTQLVRQSILFACIVVTIAFLVAIFFSRSLTRPLQQLVDAMGRVAAGDLATTIQVRSKDEISVLAKSFNQMMGDLRESREKIEEINRDLEQKVKERTQKLAEQNQTIQKTQEALLQSSRLAAAGEIAGRAAHEVLNPLTGIMSRLEKVRGRLLSRLTPEVQLLEEISNGWKTDFQQGGFDKLVDVWNKPSQIDQSMTVWSEDLQNIEQIRAEFKDQVHQTVSDTEFLLQEGQRINKIVQTMRSLSSHNREVSQVSVHDLLRRSVRIMADFSFDSGVRIVEEYQAESDAVEMDPDELIQSVTNLVRNSIQAIKADPASLSGGRIVIRTRIEGDQIAIDIVDNGIGIDPENQARLFESQFSTKSKEEGTGLGLSISRRFIRAAGGDIVLMKSEPGEETVFRIQLPLKAGDEKRKMAV